jgi:phosphopantothenoylcysteine decarboxylase/phosphopantothenate--cysteine ligase
LHAYAEDKLRRKHLDLVVANDVSAPATGFGHDTNAVLILAADGAAINVPLTDKRAVAGAVLDAVAARLAPLPSSPGQSE